jgi:hypothetical protein
MAEPKELAARLRKLATGTVEWRVQHPVERCYCISFDRSDSINPERAAREWLADFQRRWPDHEHAKYEAAEVRWFSELERAALEAADVLDAAGVALDRKASAEPVTKAFIAATEAAQARGRCVSGCAVHKGGGKLCDEACEREKGKSNG